MPSLILRVNATIIGGEVLRFFCINAITGEAFIKADFNPLIDVPKEVLRQVLEQKLKERKWIDLKRDKVELGISSDDDQFVPMGDYAFRVSPYRLRKKTSWEKSSSARSLVIKRNK